ncbi:MAG: anti-sigma factor antagonist [Jatrophihabitans sp.]|nr:MAG: anti-sigma factor antagonist [Jatrophihabitans sp.]
MELTVTERRGGHVCVVGVAGEVDLHSAPALREGLESEIERRLHGVVVDLSAVSFLDSTGLGALVSSRTAAGERGVSLPVVCTSERILKLFTITGLDGVFQIFGDLDSAVDAAG